MKSLRPRTVTMIVAAACLIGCGTNAAPIRPVVKQEIGPDKVLKKIDPFDPADPQKKVGLSGN